MRKTNSDKGFRSIDVLALAFGSMIGWGWIALCGRWATQGGMLGAMLAFVTGTIMCIFVGLTYAELTPAFPETGGGVVFAREAMGSLASLIAGLATVLAYLGVAAWEGPAFVRSIDYLIELPKIVYLWNIQGIDVYLSSVLCSIIGTVILVTINIRGAKQTAVFQTVATVGIIVVGILFLAGGIGLGSVSNVKPLFTSISGYMTVMLVVPAMFVGFDIIPQAAGEMDVPLKRIPKLLILSIIAASLWYILMILATCLSAPINIRQEGSIPVADAMAYVYGSSFWGKVCIVGALFGIITSWNGFLFGAARCLYSMAETGLLPKFLAKEHPKYHTPYAAILVSGIICACGSLLGTGALTWFINSASFGTVIMYLMVVLSFVVLRIKKPDMYRPYRIQHAKLIGSLAIIVVAFFVYLYLPAGPSSLNSVEWFMTLGWFLAGILLFILGRKRA